MPIGYCPISTGDAPVTWRPVRKALLRVSDSIVSQTVYDIGGCPVSLFEGPPDWQPIVGGKELRSREGRMRSLSGSTASLVSWHDAARSYALVANMPGEDLEQLASQHPPTQRRSPGL